MFKGFTKIFTNAVKECPAQYSDSTNGLTATFNLMCKNSINSEKLIPVTIPCGTTDNLEIIATQFGDKHEGFTAACFNGPQDEYDFLNQFSTLSEISTLKNTKLILKKIYEGYDVVCRCVRDTYSNPNEYQGYSQSFSPESSGYSHRSSYEAPPMEDAPIEDTSLFTPQNIVLGLGAVAILGLGAYTLYKKFKQPENRYSGINYLEEPSNYLSSDDEDYMPENLDLSNLKDRVKTRASARYTQFDYYNDFSDDSDNDESFTAYDCSTDEEDPFEVSTDEEEYGHSIANNRSRRR
ncbi:MAG: hypothetical protein U1E78_09560 [Gammaproteobacteria bacterium]